MALSSTSTYGTTRQSLTAAVAPAGTVVVAYPTGTVQTDYTSGNAAPTSDQMAIVNGVKYTGGTVLGFVYGASNITVTNSTTDTWPINADCYFGFPRIDPALRYNGAKAIV